MEEDKIRNRFTRLRYGEGSTIADTPDMTVRQLAEKLGLSPSAVSKLESKSLEDCKGDVPGTVPTCNAETLKRYHDFFGCSYEYLMGETAHKAPEYYNTGKDPILGLFDDSFLDKLKELLNDKEYQHFNLYMLHVFMSDPKRLQEFMEISLHYLYQIDVVNGNSDIKKADKETMTAPLWFSLYMQIRGYFEALMPKLEYGFRQHEQRQADERAAFEETVTTDDGASNTAVQPIGLDSREQSQE